ncbi:MAG: hypothetical protein IJQ62_04065, partial [Clostridia bacterium]|nr:hypothetical protein [Clostridia bacterium]
FTGLPPSISDRFYVTVEDGGILNPGLHATMNLVGQLVEKEIVHKMNPAPCIGSLYSQNKPPTSYFQPPT